MPRNKSRRREAKRKSAKKRNAKRQNAERQNAKWRKARKKRGGPDAAARDAYRAAERKPEDEGLVVYNGAKMIPSWPAKIVAAQELTTVKTADGERERIRYGDVGGDGADEGPCSDCGVVKGQYHVPVCDVETCPGCGEQALVCQMAYKDGCGGDPFSVLLAAQQACRTTTTRGGSTS